MPLDRGGMCVCHGVCRGRDFFLRQKFTRKRRGVQKSPCSASKIKLLFFFIELFAWSSCPTQQPGMFLRKKPAKFDGALYEKCKVTWINQIVPNQPKKFNSSVNFDAIFNLFKDQSTKNHCYKKQLKYIHVLELWLFYLTFVNMKHGLFFR